tara:strand:- start:642 stop:1238 length:597 start_codon:yes stop_codon:yes gene_type:complete
MNIIGICGRKRHGKDTVGEFLQEVGWKPIAFADPIKRICMDLYKFSYDQVYGHLKEEPDPRWDGLTPRHAMQQLGTEVCRSVYADTWVRYCLDLIERASVGEEVVLHDARRRGFFPYKGASQLWCVTDVRFPNEADTIRARGGQVIKVVRPSLEGTQGDGHVSETNIDRIDPDFLVLNDGTLEDLWEKVRELRGSLSR